MLNRAALRHAHFCRGHLCVFKTEIADDLRRPLDHLALRLDQRRANSFRERRVIDRIRKFVRLRRGVVNRQDDINAQSLRPRPLIGTLCEVACKIRSSGC